MTSELRLSSPQGSSRGAPTIPLVTEQSLTELVQLAARNDHRAWATLVERFGRVVWAATRTAGLTTDDAVDVSQTVWLRLAQNIGQIRDPERIGLWLHTTTRNECMKLLHQRSRTVTVDPMTAFASIPSIDEPNVIDLERIDQDRRLWAAFTDLPEKCKTLLRMLITEPPLAYVDIAAATGIAVGSIGSRRQRCLASLRAALGVRERSDQR
jgi:RNA polymerase sigma factor (sigma-70 family)